MFRNGLNMNLPWQVTTGKIVDGGETQWLSSKEKIPGAAVNKEGLVDGLLRHDRSYHPQLFWKKCFLLPAP